MSGERPTGPLPDVLARLATGMPASDTGRGRSAMARVAGWVLLAGTSVMVVVSAIVVARP